MAELTTGKKAPAIKLKNQDEQIVTLKDFPKKWIVLYFYPKDDTPGCTLEAKAFTQHITDFDDNDAVVIGVSPDSPKKHCNFIEKYNLRMQLLSDPEHSVAEKYDVWRLKKFMGREYMGIHRSTFLINPEGKIAKAWYGVNPIGHAAKVLEELKTHS